MTNGSIVKCFWCKKECGAFISSRHKTQRIVNIIQDIRVKYFCDKRCKLHYIRHIRRIIAKEDEL